MRFLVDRCAGRRLAEWLRTEGHDTVESRERGVDPGDAVLLGWAFAERRILITMDKDFGDLVFVAGADHAGIVRLPDVPAARRIALLRQILMDVVEAELTQSVVTVSGERIRIARIPPRTE